MNTSWRIILFGELRVGQGERVITRFRTQKAASLLAYLAYYHDRKHPRESLLELMLPEANPSAGRNYLRVSLSSLRRQLEPPGTPPGAVIVADRNIVGLNPNAVTTDVADFKSAMRSAERADNDAEKARCLSTAVELYRDELLPGFFDEWIDAERQQLADAYLNALRRLTRLLGQAREFDRALHYARRAVSADPLHEASHRTLMRLYTAVGRPAAALQQFEEMEDILKEQLGVAPSASSRALAREISEPLAVSSGQLVVVGGSQAIIGQRARPESRDAVNSRQKAEKKQTSIRQSSPAPMFQFPATAHSPFTIDHPPSNTGNLPLQFTRFFGREKEITQLREMLSTSNHPTTRLVTLTGLGGSGKTRLAIEVARQLQGEFPGGVWFVSLASVADPRLITGTVRDALGLPRSPDVDPLEQIVDSLSQQPALLILDNLEHLLKDEGLGIRRILSLISHPASLIHTLLMRVPALTCLVTSRQRLDIGYEREFPVPPLPLPEHSNTRTPEYLMSFPSVQLFVDRAQAVLPDFQVTNRNAPTVAALCEKLEGIPLAIELVTAWAGTLTVGQMLSRLSHRFDLLVSRRKDLPERHRSLWAAMEWSHRLLSPELRRFWQRLSVFHGGFTLEAADALSTDCGIGLSGFSRATTENNPFNPLPKSADSLRQLRERSLVLAEDVNGEMRYRLLETLREFAAEQLTEEEQADVSRRHAHFFLTFAEEAEPHLTGAQQKEWLDRLETEHDNLRAARAWAIGEAANQRISESVISQFPNFPISQFIPSEIGLRLAGALWQFWFERGYFKEGLEQLTKVLSHADATKRTAARAKALHGAGVMNYNLGQFAAARSCYEESLAIGGELGDRRRMAHAIHYLGILASERGERATARAFYEEGLTIMRELGDKEGMIRSLAMLGGLLSVMRDFETAHALLEEALALSRELGYGSGVAWTMHMKGQMAVLQQDFGAACALFQETLTLFRELGDKRGIATALVRLGEAMRLEGNDAPTRALFEEGLMLYREIGHRTGIRGAFMGLASLSLAEGQSQRAARLLGVVSRLTEETGERLRPVYVNTEAALRAALGDKAFQAAWSQGRAMTLEQAVAYALEE